MSETTPKLPIIRKVKNLGNGTMQVKLYLPAVSDAREGHELTLILPVEGSGIGEPTRGNLTEGLKQIAGDANMAVMLLSRAH